MLFKRSILLFMTLFFFFGGIYACEQDTTAENVGERVGEASEEFSQGAEEAGEEIEQGAEEFREGYREEG